MDFDNLIVICLTLMGLSVLVFIGIMSSNTDKQNEYKFKLCIENKGSWSNGSCIIPTNSK